MAFQPVPNVALITISGRVDQQLTVNDLSFEVSGGGITSVNLGNLTDAVENWVSTSLAPSLADVWTCSQVHGVDLSVPNGVQASSGSIAQGGSSSEAAPNNVAACVSFETGFSGRSFRGRNYVPAIPNDEIVLNTMQGTFMSNMLTAYGALIGAGTFLAGWQWGCVSRRTGGAARPSGVISPITAVVFKTPYVRSMRSREIGHGA